MIPEIKVIKYTDKYQDQWNNFVNKARNGTFIHLRSFMDYHADRYDDCSVLVMKGTTVVAVLPANRETDRIVSHSGLTFGGLIYGLEQRASDVRAALSAILDYYQENGISKIYYKPVPHIFHRYPAEDDLHELFVKNAHLVRRDLSSAIYLLNRPKFSKSRQSGVKKAERSGLRIVEGQFATEFYSLLTEVLKRHKAKPVHSASEILLLQSRFPDQIRLIGAFVDERLLAATWLFQFDEVIHTQYLACSDEGRQLGALDYLISQIIENSPDSIKIVSFGTSTEDGGRTLNEGLLFQKEGFGARSIVLDHYELKISAKEQCV